MVALRWAWVAVQIVVCLACLSIVVALDAMGLRRCPGRSTLPGAEGAQP